MKHARTRPSYPGDELPETAAASRERPRTMPPKRHGTCLKVMGSRIDDASIERPHRADRAARSARRSARGRHVGSGSRDRNEQPPRDRSEENDRHALGYSTGRARVIPRDASLPRALGAPAGSHRRALPAGFAAGSSQKLCALHGWLPGQAPPSHAHRARERAYVPVHRSELPRHGAAAPR